MENCDKTPIPSTTVGGREEKGEGFLAPASPGSWVFLQPPSDAPIKQRMLNSGSEQMEIFGGTSSNGADPGQDLSGSLFSR